MRVARLLLYFFSLRSSMKDSEGLDARGSHTRVEDSLVRLGTAWGRLVPAGGAGG
jgi:hypothetical protein